MSVHTESEPAANRSHFGIQRIIADIGSEIGTLLHNTLRLFVRESQDKISFIITNMVKIFLAIGIALMGIGYLLASINALIVTLLSPEIISFALARWLVPLVIGTITAIIGFILYKHGMNRVTRVNVMPARTTESLENDKNWIREKTKGKEA